MMPRIIAFTGNARHGKDTCAAHLVRRYNYARFSLASPLKAAACAMFAWSPWQIESRKDEIDPEYGISPRQVMQALGTDFGQYLLKKNYPEFARVTGRKLWVKALLARAKDEPLVVISDLCFPHEAEEIHKQGGIVIRVWRPGYPVDKSHESEAAVCRVSEDFLASNDGTIEELERQLDEIMLQLLGGKA